MNLSDQPYASKDKYGRVTLDSCYFLTFSDKEEYLLKRAEWRKLYKALSSELKNNKFYRKWESRKYSAPKAPFVFPDPFPRLVRALSGRVNAQKLLEVRHEQKRLSKLQRELKES